MPLSDSLTLVFIVALVFVEFRYRAKRDGALGAIGAFTFAAAVFVYIAFVMPSLIRFSNTDGLYISVVGLIIVLLVPFTIRRFYNEGGKNERTGG